MPRWWHRFYAWLGGYFWLPCPVCGKHFGGHEWMTGDPCCTVPDEIDGRYGVSIAICPACTLKKRKTGADCLSTSIH